MAPNQKFFKVVAMAPDGGFKKTKRPKAIMDTKNMVAPNLLESLPTDIIADIISKVGSSSVANLFSCRLSCKALDQIGKEKYVIQKVAIQEPDIWRVRFNPRYLNSAMAYSQQCAECDNPEALFQQGMRLYFKDTELEEGMGSLERAGNLGHKTAAYVLGLVLACYGSSDEKKKQGMRLIYGVKSCVGRRIVECRVRLRDFLHRHTWPDRRHRPVRFVKERPEGHEECGRKCPWAADSYYLESEDDERFCEACTCEFESSFFSGSTPLRCSLC